VERTYLWRISVVRVLEIVAKLRPVQVIKTSSEYAGYLTIAGFFSTPIAGAGIVPGCHSSPGLKAWDPLAYFVRIS